MTEDAKRTLRQTLFPSSYTISQIATIRNEAAKVSPVQALALLTDNAKDVGAAVIHFLPMWDTNDANDDDAGVVAATKGPHTSPSAARCASSLCVGDDGRGLTAEDAYAVLTQVPPSSTEYALEEPGIIACYGDRLLRAAFTLGHDCILFSKASSLTLTATLISFSFHTMYELDDDPAMPFLFAQLSWTLDTPDGEPVLVFPHEARESHRYAITSCSPFKSIPSILEQFDRIQGEQGSVVFLYNFLDAPRQATRGVADSVPIISFTDSDIIAVNPGLSGCRSLRAFSRFQYLHPLISVYINGSHVYNVHPFANLYRILSYNADTLLRQGHRMSKSSIARQIQALEQQQPQAESIITHQAGTLPAKSEAQHVLDHKLSELRHALTVETARMTEPKRINVVFGINARQRSQEGVLIFLDGRLITWLHPVGTQAASAPWDQFACGGVVGCVLLSSAAVKANLFCAGLQSNKDEWAVNDAAGLCLWQYWKHFRTSEKLLTDESLEEFWKSRGYTWGNSLDAWKKPRDHRLQRAGVAMGHIYLQCADCGKWRLTGVDLTKPNDPNAEGKSAQKPAGKEDASSEGNAPAAMLAGKGNRKHRASSSKSSQKILDSDDDDDNCHDEASDDCKSDNGESMNGVAEGIGDTSADAVAALFADDSSAFAVFQQRVTCASIGTHCSTDDDVEQLTSTSVQVPATLKDELDRVNVILMSRQKEVLQQETSLQRSGQGTPNNGNRSMAIVGSTESTSKLAPMSTLSGSQTGPTPSQALKTRANVQEAVVSDPSARDPRLTHRLPKTQSHTQAPTQPHEDGNGSDALTTDSRSNINQDDGKAKDAKDGAADKNERASTLGTTSRQAMDSHVVYESEAADKGDADKGSTAEKSDEEIAAGLMEEFKVLPWDSSSDALVKNYKRCLTYVSRDGELRKFSTMSVDELLDVDVGFVLESHQMMMSRANAEIDREVQRVQQECADVEHEISLFLESVRPGLLALNGGSQPEFDTDNPLEVARALKELEMVSNALPKNWLLEG